MEVNININSDLMINEIKKAISDYSILDENGHRKISEPNYVNFIEKVIKIVGYKIIN